MNGKISEDLEKYLHEQVQAGHFESEIQVVEAALRQMRDRAVKRAELQRRMLEHDEMEPIGRAS